jgi:ribosomal protein S18 acetylase RimI-like enzyme
MDEIEYQVVSEAPVEAIVALYEAGGWWQESEQWRAIIPRMITGSFCFMVARSRDGRLVGMGRAISDGVSDAYIQDVVVLEEVRKRGIGRELVKRLAEYCSQQGIGWVGLVAEPGTQAFYESLGFRALEGFRPMLYGKQG